MAGIRTGARKLVSKERGKIGLEKGKKKKKNRAGPKGFWKVKNWTRKKKPQAEKTKKEKAAQWEPQDQKKGEEVPRHS